MKIVDNKKKIILYGNSRNVSSFIICNKQQIEVLGIIENDRIIKEEIFFDEFPVLDNYVEVKRIINEQRATLVTFPEINPIEIKEELPLLIAGKNWLDYSLFGFIKEIDFTRISEMFNSPKEAGDYIKTRIQNRKIALLHGNCQKEIIFEILKNNKEFSLSFVLLRINAIYFPEFCLNDIDILKKGLLFENIELFISQPISLSNRFGDSLSTKLMRNSMSVNCKTILFPNCFFEGYFPDYYPLRIDGNFKKLEEISLFCSTNSIMDTLIMQGMKKEKIINFMHSDFYSKDKLIQESLRSIKLLEKKEKENQTDIIISDYIRGNYQKKLLFRSVNHPITEVLIVLSRRILTFMGMGNDSVYYDDFFSLRDSDQSIPPCVSRHLFGEEKKYLYFPHRTKFPDCIVELDDFYSMYYNYFEPVITNKDNFLIGQISTHERGFLIRLKWRKYLSSSKYRIQRVDTEDNVWKTISWNEEDDEYYDDMNVKIGEKYQYKVLYYENQNIVFTSNSILIHLIQIPEHCLIDVED